MAKLDRIKRRLVREAVRENLDLLAGRLPSRRRARRWGATAGGVLLALTTGGVLTAGYALNGGDPLAALVRREAPPPAVTVGATAVPPAVVDAEPAPPSPEPVPSEQQLAEAMAAARPVDHQVFPLAVRRVVIDPGHGGDRVGTRTPSGLAEKDLTLDIGLRLARLLEAAGFEVLMTRREDVTVPLRERVRQANAEAADLFVSVHVNWIDDGGGMRGVETYYLGTTDDPYLTRLAAAENRDSGYALADLRQVLEGIYSGVRGGKSRELAGAVQAALYQSLKKVNPKLTDRGVKTAPFLVLVETEMPAILAEVACLSNPKEADLLTKPLYRQYIAEALARGIRSYADGDPPPPPQLAAGP